MSKLPESKEKISILLSIAEAADSLGVTTKTLRRWENKGYLMPSRTPGGHRRYKLSSLKAIKRKTAIKIYSPKIRGL